MKYFSFLLLILIVAASCKPEPPDKEPVFTLSFISNDTSFSLASHFQRIYGMSRGKINEHITMDSNSLFLPLNLSHQSVVYYFEKDSLIDSLQLNYRLQIKKNAYDYSAIPENLEVTTSFDSVRLECANWKKSHCTHAKSATVHF